MGVSHVSNPVNGSRLCLDFVNLPFTSGDPVAHATSWLELVDFLSGKRIVSPARSEELISLTESDPKAAGSLLAQHAHGVSRDVENGPHSTGVAGPDQRNSSGYGRVRPIAVGWNWLEDGILRKARGTRVAVGCDCTVRC